MTLQESAGYVQHFANWPEVHRAMTGLHPDGYWYVVLIDRAFTRICSIMAPDEAERAIDQYYRAGTINWTLPKGIN